MASAFDVTGRKMAIVFLVKPLNGVAAVGPANVNRTTRVSDDDDSTVGPSAGGFVGIRTARVTVRRENGFAGTARVAIFPICSLSRAKTLPVPGRVRSDRKRFKYFYPNAAVREEDVSPAFVVVLLEI